MKDKKYDGANWLIVRVMARPQYLAYAIFSAEQVIDIYEKKYPKDNRPRKAIEAAKLVLKNDTKKNRAAAWDSAGAAGAAAWDSAGAAGSAAWAAGAAARAAWAAARDSARAAARDSAWAAARAAGAAAGAAARAAGAAAGAAAGEKLQIKILNYGLKLLKENSEVAG